MATANDLYGHCLGLMHLKDYKAAEGPLREFLQYDPSHAEAITNLGIALAQQGRIDEAWPLFERAMSYSRNPDLLTVAAGILTTRGMYAEAVAMLDKALASAPDKPSARWNRASANLALGKWSEGWADYEFGKVNGSRPVRTLLPQWNGEPIAGKRLLVWSEQGYGDTIWATKMLRILRRLGIEFTLEVQEPLVSLMQTNGHSVFAQPKDNSMTAQADIATSLMSLPHVLGLTSDDWDTDRSPYLAADKELARIYGQALPADRRIGIVWQGRHGHHNDKARSLPRADLAVFAGIPLLGLQKGNAEYEDLPEGIDIANFGECLSDYSVTAAILANLDAVITVDTSVAHLAGALGIRTFLLLPTVIDFRWQNYTSYCPWYPSISIFRQSDPGDWSTPISNLIKELKHA